MYVLSHSCGGRKSKVNLRFHLFLPPPPPLPPESAKGGSAPSSPADAGSLACGSLAPPLHSLLPGPTWLCVQMSPLSEDTPRSRAPHLNGLPRQQPCFVLRTWESELPHRNWGEGGYTIQPKRHSTSYWSLWSKGKSETLVSPYLKL